MNKLHIAVCESNADEFRAALINEGITDVEIISFPSLCIRMNGATEYVKSSVQQDIAPENMMIIGGAQCDVLKVLPPEWAKARIYKVQNCFYNYCSSWFIDKLIQDGSYIVTSGWLKNWRQSIDCWGFDAVGIKKFFNEFSRQIIVLDTGTDGAVNVHAAEISEYVGLPVNILTIDLEYLGLFLKTIVYQWRLREVTEAAEAASKSYLATAKEIADFAMMFDVISKIAEVSGEAEMIQKLIDTFAILFVPKQIGYYGIDRSFSVNGISEENFELGLELIHARERLWCFSSSGTGFLLLLEHKQDVFGVLEVDDFAFQEYQNHYLNSMLNINRVCGLAISNARQYEYIVQANERMQYISTHDQLTGLYNRNYFDEQIRNLYDSDVQAVGIFVCDIDGLKHVNDAYGHVAGDELIKIAASIIRSSFSDSDIVVRLGGDEFSVIVKDCTPELAASALDRVREAVNKRKSGASRGDTDALSYFDISAGYALAYAPFKNLERTFTEADDLMYSNKRLRKSGSDGRLL